LWHGSQKESITAADGGCAILKVTMSSLWLRDPVVLGAAAVAVVAAGGTSVYFALRKKETAEEVERRRREHLVVIGRIIDGTVLDMRDIELEGHSARHVFYQYAIAGVTYECSQDVTLLEAQVANATSTPGMPTSVRYDPHNPTNSIVVAESWTGLHHAHNSLRFVREQAARQEAATSSAGHVSG
jgi:hypothetical protein